MGLFVAIRRIIAVLNLTSSSDRGRLLLDARGNSPHTCTSRIVDLALFVLINYDQEKRADRYGEYMAT